MINKGVTVFLPCRKGSGSVVRKNTKPFANIEKGLIALKLSQLVQCKNVNKIIVSTDDLHVKNVSNYYNEKFDMPIEVVERSEELASSTSATDSIVLHARDIITEGIINGI
jgi:CMP-N-acetylneuraminic acid synthetase